ncbi:MAG: hypothetical protein SVM80_13405 [Halobacteriota archaeon]|nr:hypothetical protein [Halobacteriota archaeon]
MVRERVDSFLYYDLKREQEEKSRFYERLHNVIESLENRSLRAWDNPRKVFEDVSRDLSSYL